MGMDYVRLAEALKGVLLRGAEAPRRQTLSLP